MTTTGAGDAPLRLGPAGRVLRVAGLLAAGTMFLLGTVVGQDDWWPFSPWRMFAASTAPTGAVQSLVIENRVEGSARWAPAPLSPASVGMNRAEVEGREPDVERRPGLLGTLAEAHSRLHPDDPAWTGVRLVRESHVLLDGATTGEVRRAVVAKWTAAGAP